MGSYDITESDDAFEIAIEGLTVTQCRFDYAVTLVLDDGTTSFTIRIAEPFALRVGAGGTDAWSVDPEHRPPEGAPVLALLDLAAKRLLAFKDGRLQLSFDGDWSVEVPSGTHYEAWQLTGADGRLLLVSAPGGNLATFWP